jgi:protein SCO1
MADRGPEAVRQPASRRGLVAAAIVMALAAGVAVGFLVPPDPPLSLAAGTALAEPKAVAEFSLVDEQGRRFGREALEGRWTLVFTGFTHCPDICPLTLSTLAALRERLPDERIGFLFLSVDPARDTPARMADYLAHFGGGLDGATGEPAEIEKLTRSLGLAHLQNPGVGEEYTVDHSTALVLIDPEARLAGYFRAPHDVNAIAGDLKALPH